MKNFFTIFFVISNSALSSSFSNQMIIQGKIIEDNDLSAISCISKNQCLIASDETQLLQSAKLNDNSIIINKQTIKLGRNKNEFDIEGLTNDGEYFYATGSHGLSKKAGNYQKSRYQVFKLKINDQGELIYIKASSLSPILKSNDQIKTYFRKSIHKNGVNIEGLGYYEGKLYFGFRSPVIKGMAQVLSVSTSMLFDNHNDPKIQLNKIENFEYDLNNKGIRSLEIKKSNLYLVAGNKNESEHSVTELYIFNHRSSELVQITQVPNSFLKLEGFEFLSEKEVILLYDSMKNGLPTRHQI